MEKTIEKLAKVIGLEKEIDSRIWYIIPIPKEFTKDNEEFGMHIRYCFDYCSKIANRVPNLKKRYMEILLPMIYFDELSKSSYHGKISTIDFVRRVLIYTEMKEIDEIDDFNDIIPTLLKIVEEKESVSMSHMEWFTIVLEFDQVYSSAYITHFNDFYNEYIERMDKECVDNINVAMLSMFYAHNTNSNICDNAEDEYNDKYNGVDLVKIIIDTICDYNHIW